MESETPKRPLTPYFMFRDKQKSKGLNMGPKELGEKWKSMTEMEKQPFMDMYQEARTKFDDYLLSKGINPLKSSIRKSIAPLTYTETRIRSMLGLRDIVKRLTLKYCAALGKLTVIFECTYRRSLWQI